MDLALRIEGLKPAGRLVPSHIYETMPVQVGLRFPEDVDAEVLAWLRQAYSENS